ncbi:unnamed protein product [Arctia plantaginis]|uniref:Uncharacterized protein n=1 Tax=Arctia plantaginis TaxID=874455 RepID=A0A8S0Z0W6_ARCPL|nr:unnamed protein product [Arctia plantaginis]
MAAKRATKRAVARVRSGHLQPLHEKLEFSEWQNLIYKLARSRIKVAQDISKCRCVKDLGSDLLCKDGRSRRSPHEAWKAIGPCGVGTLSNLFNRVLFTGQISSQWRLSIITPVLKGKG